MGETVWLGKGVRAIIYRGVDMPAEQQTLRVAMLAWEIGRVGSGVGTKLLLAEFLSCTGAG